MHSFAYQHVELHEQLALTQEPGWGVAFYVTQDTVRVYEQSAYLLSLIAPFACQRMQHCAVGQSVYCDISETALINILQQCEATYFDVGYGIRWLSDAFYSDFAFSKWRSAQ